MKRDKQWKSINAPLIRAIFNAPLVAGQHGYTVQIRAGKLEMDDFNHTKSSLYSLGVVTYCWLYYCFDILVDTIIFFNHANSLYSSVDNICNLRSINSW